jgi:hypothetical protein
MDHPLDSMARAIFAVALQHDHAGEVLQCLFEGGSVTVDAKTKQLVMVDVGQLKQLGGPSADVVIHFEEPSDATWYRYMLRVMLDNGAAIVPNKSEFGFGTFTFTSNPHPEAVIEDL